MINKGLCTVNYEGEYLDVTNQDVLPLGIAFSGPGHRLYVLGGAGDSIYQYDLGDLFRLKTAEYTTKYLSVSSWTVRPSGIELSQKGTVLTVISEEDACVITFKLHTPFEIDTAEFINYQSRGENND